MYFKYCIIEVSHMCTHTHTYAHTRTHTNCSVSRPMIRSYCSHPETMSLNHLSPPSHTTVDRPVAFMLQCFPNMLFCISPFILFCLPTILQVFPARSHKGHVPDHLPPSSRMPFWKTRSGFTIFQYFARGACNKESMCYLIMSTEKTHTHCICR